MGAHSVAPTDIRLSPASIISAFHMTNSILVLALAGSSVVAGCHDGSSLETDRVQEALVNPPGLMSYYGGRVISNVRVVRVDWNGGNGNANWDAFYTDITGSAYLSWLASVYATDIPANGVYTTLPGNQNPGTGTYWGHGAVTVPGLITNLLVQNTLATEINAGRLPFPDANTLYMVHVPNGVRFVEPDGIGPCGFHFWGILNTTIYPYAVVGTNEANGGCGGGTYTASHELVEAIVNPYPTERSQAWYNVDLGAPAYLAEIADVCDAAGSITINGNPYAVAKIYNNATGGCIVSGGGIITIDATALWPQSIAFQGPSFSSTAATQFGVGSGNYFVAATSPLFVVGPNLYDIGDFTVQANGTIDYGTAFDAQLAGRGTYRLRLTGTPNNAYSTAIWSTFNSGLF